MTETSKSIGSSNVTINGFGISVSSGNTTSVFINGKSLDSFLNPPPLPEPAPDDSEIVEPEDEK